MRAHAARAASGCPSLHSHSPRRSSTSPSPGRRSASRTSSPRAVANRRASNSARARARSSRNRRASSARIPSQAAIASPTPTDTHTNGRRMARFRFDTKRSTPGGPAPQSTLASRLLPVIEHDRESNRFSQVIRTSARRAGQFKREWFMSPDRWTMASRRATLRTAGASRTIMLMRRVLHLIPWQPGRQVEHRSPNEPGPTGARFRPPPFTRRAPGNKPIAELPYLSRVRPLWLSFSRARSVPARRRLPGSECRGSPRPAPPNDPRPSCARFLPLPFT
jgi:hypothetical protein